MFSLGLPTNIYGVFIVKGECRALSREQQSGVAWNRGGKADTHPGRPWVLLDLGTGIPSDSSPVILPRHPSLLQNSYVFLCDVQRPLGVQERADNPVQGREQSGGDWIPTQLLQAVLH